MHVPIGRNLIFRSSVLRHIGPSGTKRSQAFFSPSHIGNLMYLMLVSCAAVLQLIFSLPHRTESEWIGDQDCKDAC